MNAKMTEQVANELNVPVEAVVLQSVSDGCAFFVVNGAEYSARTTKHGIKRGTVRKD
jgi:hypothetical protein